MLTTVYDDIPNRKSYMVLVIGEEQMKRMRQADPITLGTRDFTPGEPGPMFPQNTTLIVAYEEDEETIIDLVRHEGTFDAIAYICRGYQVLPEDEKDPVAFRAKGEVRGKNGESSPDEVNQIN